MVCLLQTYRYRNQRELIDNVLSAFQCASVKVLCVVVCRLYSFTVAACIEAWALALGGQHTWSFSQRTLRICPYFGTRRTFSCLKGHQCLGSCMWHLREINMLLSKYLKPLCKYDKYDRWIMTCV